MKKIAIYISALALSLSFVQCSDYLDTSSPENADGGFVTFLQRRHLRSCRGAMPNIARIVLWELIAGTTR